VEAISFLLEGFRPLSGTRDKPITTLPSKFMLRNVHQVIVSQWQAPLCPVPLSCHTTTVWETFLGMQPGSDLQAVYPNPMWWR